VSEQVLPPIPVDREHLLSHQGHMLEWVLVALSDDELRVQEWPHQAVWQMLCELDKGTENLPYGAYSHCVRALRLYKLRVEL